MQPESGRITLLLNEWKRGTSGAEEALVPLIYDELKRLARTHLRRERQNHTIQATALVHEAYLRVAGGAQVDWVDRGHFFAVAARVMRRILVDYAKQRKAQKRGGEVPVVALDAVMEPGVRESWDHILDLHEALDRLAKIDERAARVIELRYFSGLEIEEIAVLIGKTGRTVKRDLQFAQTWLYAEMFPERGAVSPETDKLRLLK